MADRRPSPEKLLEKINEEKSLQRGKLKIYLGAAPGVGKTHTMMQDALAKRERSLDVIAGVVESHGRKEIDAMLQSFEILPRRIVDYHGKPLLEFDLDAALRRSPSLILIDEMAHMNIPGLRHAKRWQDIKELLDRGIDVYTTLNVQHIESLNDIIAQIIGIRVRETVPDSMLGLADTIELVDLAPDDLLRRLQDGKVYIPAQAELASQHFFRKGNLIALRELALRFTAERVDEQVLQHRHGEGIEQTWPTVERLLVCIGHDVGSNKVIRAARRMATGLHAAWIAVHVEAPRMNFTEQQRNIAIQNLRLAEQLGAETRILTGVDVVKEIITFARHHNVTKIVIGKRLRSRWREIIANSLAFELVRHSGEIDVYIIRSDDKGAAPPEQPIPIKRKGSLLDYAFAFITTTITTLINLLIFPYVGMVGLSNLVMIFLVGVVIVALRGKLLGPSILASALSSLSFTYFFVTPRFTFSMTDIQYVLTFGIMMMVAQIISHLTILNRQQAEIAYLGEQRTAALHALTRQLASTRGITKLLEIAMRYISEVFDSEVLALLSENGVLKIRASSSTKKMLNAKELGVAQWVYDLGQIAGLGTDTLPFSDSLYVPLHGSQVIVGVLKIRPRQSELLLIPEQLHLLEACANQIALALEVDRLQEKARQTTIAIETERLRAALFSSLSHELQNPLAVIVRLINKLTKKTGSLDEAETEQSVKNLYHEAERLNRLINNLLQITQLEEGKVQLHKKLYSIDEIIKTTLNRIEKKLNNKFCIIQIAENLPFVPFDKVLLEQVLVNLIENAILYSPLDTPIEISASLQEGYVLLSVGDHGPGLMVADIQKVFDKFYRGEKPKEESGAGLGLSVCQSIIKAHGGNIWAENRTDGGAIFYFVLPLRESSVSAIGDQSEGASE
jgi:two-component system sensor histidine kinase KdpD